VFTRCLFCHKPFPENGRLTHLPHGRRIAYDPAEGRLWTVCESCHRWNLCPIEHREAALYELERLARDQAKHVAHTAHVALLTVGSLLLIRVGEAPLVEQAWWRYGRELERRKASFESPRSVLTAYTFGALQAVGRVVGLNDEDLSVGWDDEPIRDILRWRRFGWAAWHGRVHCPYCNSALRALRYDMSWWVYPLHAADGSLEIGVPCPRCDPWTPENVYRIEGPQAANALRRCLASRTSRGRASR
jgi:hypothetical protein